MVPLHHHVNEQVTMLKSGALRFEMGGEQVLGGGRRAGDSAGPAAPVEALEDSMATDLFTPGREDWIRGDDAYLRK